MFNRYLNFVVDEQNRIGLIFESIFCEGILGQGLGGLAGAAVGAATGVDMKLAGAAGGAIGGAVTAKKGERLKDAAIGGLGGAAIGWGGEKMIGPKDDATQLSKPISTQAQKPVSNVPNLNTSSTNKNIQSFDSSIYTDPSKIGDTIPQFNGNTSNAETTQQPLAFKPEPSDKPWKNASQTNTQITNDDLTVNGRQYQNSTKAAQARAAQVNKSAATSVIEDKIKNRNHQQVAKNAETLKQNTGFDINQWANNVTNDIAKNNNNSKNGAFDNSGTSSNSTITNDNKYYTGDININAKTKHSI